MVVNCVVCGKEFEAQKSTKKYCSNECLNASRRKKYAEKGRNRGISEKVCPICGKVFTPKSAAASQRTCCYDCMPAS